MFSTDVIEDSKKYAAQADARLITSIQKYNMLSITISIGSFIMSERGINYFSRLMWGQNQAYIFFLYQAYTTDRY